jgi:hypothetical protein
VKKRPYSSTYSRAKTSLMQRGCALVRSSKFLRTPLIAGATLRGALGAPFLIAGALKSAYDLGLYVLFRNVEVDGERAAKPAAAG